MGACLLACLAVCVCKCVCAFFMFVSQRVECVVSLCVLLCILVLMALIYICVFILSSMSHVFNGSFIVLLAHSRCSYVVGYILLCSMYRQRLWHFYSL